MRRIKMTLDTDSINATIKELEEYADSIDDKAERFLSKLLEHGIETAKTFTEVQLDDSGSLGYLVTFSKITMQMPNQVIGVLVGEDKAKFVSQWVVKNGEIRSAEISPILMYEFGSGAYAEPGKEMKGLRYPDFASNPRGSFPSPTAKEHADRGLWFYMDIDGEWHSSSGIVPTQPMYNAYVTMYREIISVAKQVFRED